MKEEEVAVADFLDCCRSMNTETVSFKCPNCQKDSIFLKKNYIKSWPKYLWVVVSRIKYENWVLKKDITEIDFSSEIIDFSFLKTPSISQNEFPLQGFPFLIINNFL